MDPNSNLNLNVNSNLNFNTLYDVYDPTVHNLCTNYSATSPCSSLRFVTRNIQTEIIVLLQQWPVFVGCHSWLSDYEILRNMERKSVGFCINKETTYHMVKASDKEYAATLMGKYNMMKRFDSMSFSSLHRNTILGKTEKTATTDVIRCMGVSTHGRKENPRMHNKILILGILMKNINDESLVFSPRVGVTGSYNLTMNARRSLENVCIIQEPTIVQSMYCEWAQIMIYSEPLQWISDLPFPVMRLYNDDSMIENE